MKHMGKTIFLLTLLFAPIVEACEEPHLKYFSWAALKLDPPKPTNEITKVETQSRESKGEAYYIATYCKSGEVFFLEKRWNKRTFSKMKYNYVNGKYSGVEVVNINSK